MGYGNQVILNQTDLSKELSISRSKINISLKTLIDYGLIRKLPKSVGNVGIYQVKPILIYKGTKANFTQCVNDYMGWDNVED